MDNYLCASCSVKHIGGELQSFLPFFVCAKCGKLDGMKVKPDDKKPLDLPNYCPSCGAKVIQ